MEFFVCTSGYIGDVFLDGNNQGRNKDMTGQLLVKQCNEGPHLIKLKCLNGINYPAKSVNIAGTDPIAPAQVPFP